MKTSHPLWELFIFRMRAMWREPAALFWTFAFPLLTSVALGLAFRNRELPELPVAVVDGTDADRIATSLDAAAGLMARRMSETEGRDALRRGKVALVLIPGAQPELLMDPTQPEGRTARLMTVDALERLNGRVDQLVVQERPVTAAGTRYIDFLIPGLLGLGLMSSGVWGLGWAVVQMRTGKLLKPETHKARLRVHHLSGEPDFVGYGQGIYKVGEFCGHGGRQPGFSSEMWYLPHRDATIIVNVNREDELVPQRPSTFVLEDIIEILFPKYAV